MRIKMNSVPIVSTSGKSRKVEEPASPKEFHLPVLFVLFYYYGTSENDAIIIKEEEERKKDRGSSL